MTDDLPTIYDTVEIDGKTGYECKECGRLYGDWSDRDCDHSLPTMERAGEHIPVSLKDDEIWFVWDRQMKRPLAPWRTGHMFPVKWGEGVLDDPEYDHEQPPETDYQRASIIAELSPAQIESEYSPTVTDWRGMDGEYAESEITTPDTITPTVMLLPEDRMPDDGLIFVDFDDVRNPATGEVTHEVADLVDDLDTFTEISTSGTGLHGFLRGSLPEGVTQVQAPLHECGHIEMYDHGRFVGNTWWHVAGTPTEIREDDGIVQEIIDEYAGAGNSSFSDVGADFDGEFNAEDASDYYTELDVSVVADQGRFAEHRGHAPGDEWKGPHPVHGAQSGEEWDSESANFNVDPESGMWYCFLHEVGGSAIHLIPFIEGWVECSVEWPQQASEAFDARMLLKACLCARDKYDPEGKLEDAEPPYKALVAVADIHDLPFEDESDNRLGDLTRGTAETIYQQIEADDVDLGGTSQGDQA